MADHNVNFTFSDNFSFVDGQFSGNVNIDYTTQLATGTVSASHGGFENTFNLGAGVPLTTSAIGSYQLFVPAGSTNESAPSVSFAWSGETPTSLVYFDYNYALGQIPAYAGNPPVTSTVIAVCFASGCRIATERGEVAVESLTTQDRVVTAAGQLRPIRWIGSRKFDCSRDERARALRPVRIVRDAFGPGKPCRDLFLSPGHSVCVTVVDELFVRACDLVNGSTVAQVYRDEVVYWHVELDSHDVILAEGLPVESYLDVGNRPFFLAAAGASRPGEARVAPCRPTLTEGTVGRLPNAPQHCRPLISEGEVLTAIRTRLRARAIAIGWSMREAPMRELCLVVENQTVLPQVEGERAWFSLRAETAGVLLVSDTSVPFQVSANTDGRLLGVDLAELTIHTGGDRRSVLLGDPRLEVGFHEVERMASGSIHRWTNGRAYLPATLWQGCSGDITIEVRILNSLPRWVAPTGGIDEAFHAQMTKVPAAA